MSDAMQIRHILAPVDLGESSRSALRYVRFLAKSSGARVTLFYADSAFALQADDHLVAGSCNPDGDEARLLEAAVREFADPFFDGVPYEVIVGATDARQAIPRVARKIGADLIIMGTHGRTGISRAMASSITDPSRDSDPPLVAVPAHA